MSVLVTICARGGSKGVKDKNIRSLNGKPLIAYTIEQAKLWPRATKMVVSTDSTAIAQTAKHWGAEAPFLRPKELAEDNSPKMAAIRHALIESEKIFGLKFSVIVDLDVTSPIRKVSDIENCYLKFVEHKPLTVFSVVHAHRNPYFNMVEENGGSFVKLCKPLPGGVTRRQDAPKVYDMNASIYCYQREFLLDASNQNPCTDRSVACLMDDISRFDIDTETDFKFVEFLMREEIYKQ